MTDQIKLSSPPARLTKPTNQDIPVAKALNASPTIFTDNINDNSNLRALDKDITDYDKTIAALKAGQSKDIYNKLANLNDTKDPKWYTDFQTTTNKDVINKIESNLNNQLTNVASEYNDVSRVYNTLVTSDIDANLRQLNKTADEVATKTRVVEINHNYTLLKAKKINALKIGLILVFLTVFPLVLAMSKHIGWLTFFGALVGIVVVYGIYLIYVFTQDSTNPHTSPYTSDYQAFEDWLSSAISSAGNDLTKCSPCPTPNSKPKPDPTPSKGDTDVYVGDNTGFIYYDGSSPQQTITSSSITPSEIPPQ